MDHVAVSVTSMTEVLDTYERPCPRCGGTAHEPGVVQETASNSLRWLPGVYRKQYVGWRWHKTKGDALVVEAVRCRGCGRLELFARHIG
jgi:ribosomal protein S27AE